DYHCGSYAGSDTWEF
nr:immunoglobulin light chain junction region [Macaca mulatta]MOW07145.1 immunoglobulin light chain junction region [Macaca mulatta]MOW07730.1 immunoglobulin light chain junction region [Macaca mulatta]